MFEHHYDNMIIKKYTFSDINYFLKKNNFYQIYKSKMPFRKHLNISIEEAYKLTKLKVSVLIANYNNQQYI